MDDEGQLLYQHLPAARQTELENLFITIDGLVREHMPRLIRRIFAEEKDKSIYHIGLFYAGGSWGYCIPTFSTACGLRAIAERYAKRGHVTVDEYESILRWSFGDSPYHDDKRYRDELASLDERLSQFSDWCYDDTGIDAAIAAAELDDEDDVLLIETVHNRCWDMVTKALHDVIQAPEIQPEIERHNCVISLCAGDQEQETWLAGIAIIHDQSVASRVRQELHVGYRLAEKDYALSQAHLKAEEDNPTQPSFQLDDLLPILDTFEPELTYIHECVVWAKNAEYVDSLDTSSEIESRLNRIPIMEILKDSPHYEEIDRLYGYFIGPEFDEQHILAKFIKLASEKVCALLKRKYPEMSFEVYYILSRSSLSFLTFRTKRNDDFVYSRYVSEGLGGVEDVVVVGR